jgi:short-subunit dehydrogenase
MTSLPGKRILITGAASGIGQEACRLAVLAGAEVVGVSRRGDRLQEFAAEIGNRFTPLSLDLELASSAEAIGECGRFDAAICNAGRGCTRMPLETDFPLLEVMMRANVLTAMNTVAGVLPPMREHGAGVLVVVGSILARAPTAPWRAAYSASKAALAALVAGWRQQLVPEGIAVKLVCPGLTATEFQSVANPTGIELPKLSAPFMTPQTAKEVAEIVLDSAYSECDEVYTRPESAEWISGVYSSLAAGVDPLKNVLLP